MFAKETGKQAGSSSAAGGAGQRLPLAGLSYFTPQHT